MELKRRSDTLAHVLKTVGRNSDTFRPYLSFADGEEAEIRLILMNRAGEESPGEESEDPPASASIHGESLATSPPSVSSTSESL